jgi:predicted nucleic acid-binding Zn ribbon protein
MQTGQQNDSTQLSEISTFEEQPPTRQSSELPASEGLFCTICTDPIPSGRDQRQTATCSEKCKNRLDAIRAAQRAARKCSHCLHPSTPEERASWREWRASRGDLKRGATKGTVDRSGGPTKQELAVALRGVLPLLVAFGDRMATEDPSSVLQPIAGQIVPRHGSSVQTRLRFWIPKLEQLAAKTVDKDPESSTLIGEASNS